MYGFESYKKGYLKGADGKYYKVSDKVFTDYMRLIWREEYQEKRDRKIITNKNDTGSSREKSFPKVVSYDSITDANGDRFLPKQRSVEDDVIRKIVHTCLHRAMDQLSHEESVLLEKLYFEGLSMKEYATAYKVPRTTVQYRHKKILAKLRKIMEKDYEFSKEMLLEAFISEER